MPPRASRVSGFPLLLCVGALSTAAAQAPVRPAEWEFGGGVFVDQVDTSGVTGPAFEVARWRGDGSGVRKGTRLSVLWGEETVDLFDIEDLPTWSETRSSNRSARLGYAMELGVWDGHVEPFVEIEPSALLLRSVYVVTSTSRSTGDVNVFDYSKWLVGPAVGLGGGVRISWSDQGPRLRLRGTYIASALGGKGEDGWAFSPWRAWSVTAGMGWEF
jgi:hypothetical protein